MSYFSDCCWHTIHLHISPYRLQVFVCTKRRRVSFVERQREMSTVGKKEESGRGWLGAGQFVNVGSWLRGNGASPVVD